MKDYGLDGVLVQRFVGTIRASTLMGDTVLKNIMVATRNPGGRGPSSMTSQEAIRRHSPRRSRTTGHTGG